MNDFFFANAPVITASAPGRMDVMGGIADYSGSLLLQMPIKQLTSVTVQLRNDGVFHLRTRREKKQVAECRMQVSAIRQKTLEEAGSIIKSISGGDWAVYVLGCFLVLQQEKNTELSGANVLIESDIPWGKGVSSSAALEIATLNALMKLYDLKLEKTELAVLAQKAENQVAGAPCGLMDQLTAHLGKKNKLLPLICQPHEVIRPIGIPRGIHFTGIDSGIRHAVSGASYAEVRTAAFMGYSVIALHEGASLKDLEYGKISGDWSRLPYKGYLANIPVALFQSKYETLLPEQISGKEFLHQCGVSIDKVTRIEENKIYRPRICAAHPVYENERINEFASLLMRFKKQENKTAFLSRMGELMLQSHRSYNAVGLGNAFTDEIVDSVVKAGVENNVYGARITGGGSGGTVCVLGFGKEGKQTVKDIYNRYKKARKKKLFLFAGSSNGAFYLNQYI